MSTTRIENYLEKAFIKPINYALHPLSLAGGGSWKKEVGRGASAIFVRDGVTSEGILNTLAYYDGSIGVGEALDPRKCCDPAKITLFFARGAKLSIAKGISEVTNAPPYSHCEATGLRKAATIFFTLPFTAAEVLVAPFAYSSILDPTENTSILSASKSP